MKKKSPLRLPVVPINWDNHPSDMSAIFFRTRMSAQALFHASSSTVVYDDDDNGSSWASEIRSRKSPLPSNLSRSDRA